MKRKKEKGQADHAGVDSSSSVARSATAAEEGSDGQRPPLQPKRTKSEAMKDYWREVKAGTRERIERLYVSSDPDRNPLFALPEKERSELFVWLRECPYRDAVRVMIREKGLPNVSEDQISEFFAQEAEDHWLVRMSRAADEANALVRLAEDNVPKFSAGILAALGQEAFRQIVRGNVDPDTMSKLTKLFLQARSNERVDQMQELRQEKVRHELQEQVDHALEKLAEEVERHPGAREAFEALRRELAENREERE